MHRLTEYRKAQLVFLLSPRIQGSIVSFKSLSEAFYLRKVLLWWIGGFVSCVTIPIVRKFWKMQSILMYLVNQTEFFQQLQAWVHQSESQSIALLLYSWFRMKNHWYWSLNKNHVSPRFMLLLKMIHLDYRNGVSVTTGLISFMRVKLGSLTLREKDSIQVSVSWLFASKSGHSQESNVFQFFLLCRYSISYFSITIGLISSSKVAIESLKLLQWSSIR